jgi:hypothetical protein
MPLTPHYILRPVATYPVVAAALDWWEGQRPPGMTATQHLANPAVRLTNPDDINLAEAVASIILDIQHDATPTSPTVPPATSPAPETDA